MQNDSLEEIDHGVFGNIRVFWTVAIGGIVVAYVEGGETGLGPSV